MFETIRLSSYLSLRQPWSWMACTLVMFCCVLTHAGAADKVDKAEKTQSVPAKSIAASTNAVADAGCQPQTQVVGHRSKFFRFE